MLELSWNGQNNIELSDGSNRTFVNDGDTIIVSGSCSNGTIRIGFGECVCPVASQQ